MMKKSFPLLKRLSFQLTTIVIVLVLPCFFLLIVQGEKFKGAAGFTLLLALLAPLGILLFFAFRHFLDPLCQIIPTDNTGRTGETSWKKSVNGSVAAEEGTDALQQESEGLVGQKVQKDEGDLDDDADRRMEAARLMASGLAHDLNNILTGIVSYPELLLMKLEQDSPLRGPIESIREAGGRAADVVKELQTLAGNRRISKEQTSINKLVCEYLESPEHQALLRIHPELELKIDLKEELPPIFCSKSHISSCLANLLCNGMTSAGKGGTVTVSTGHKQGGDHNTNDDGPEQGDYVTLSVSDSGEAIGEEHLARIFEPFYMKKVMERKCSGLGLAVAWNIAREHKGKIRVDSSDRGNRFTVYLPTTPP